MGEDFLYLEENLNKLNKKYNPLGITLKVENDIIKIIEERDFLLQNNETLKLDLRENLSIKFNWKKKYWYVGIEKQKLLRLRKLKTEPFLSIDELEKKLNEYISMIEDEEL